MNGKLGAVVGNLELAISTPVILLKPFWLHFGSGQYAFRFGQELKKPFIARDSLDAGRLVWSIVSMGAWFVASHAMGSSMAKGRWAGSCHVHVRFSAMARRRPITWSIPEVDFFDACLGMSSFFKNEIGLTDPSF